MGRNRQVRSNEFAEWLNRQMAAAGWGPTELSRRIGGVRHQSVSRWANGQVLPDMDKIPRLAELFGVDEAELARLAGRLSGEWQPTEISYEDALRMVQIKSPWFLPVEGIASAGPGAFQDGIWRKPADRGRSLRAVEITGDCLAPRIEPGDVVIVDLDARWEMGNVVVARHHDELVAKQYHGDELRGMDGKVIPASECEIIGVAVEVNKRLI